MVTGQALPGLRGLILAAALFSGLANVLALASPLFMLEVYDRVIPSRSLPTLVALLILVGVLFAFSGLFDALKARVIVRFAGLFDAALSRRVFAVIARLPLKGQVSVNAQRPAQELDQVRNYLSSQGPASLLDLPWTPVYVAVCFFLHPLIGWLIVGTLLVLVILTLATELRTRKLLLVAGEAQAERNKYGDAANRDAEAVVAMGMSDRIMARWSAAHFRFMTLQRQAADMGGSMASVSKAMRYAVQAAALGLGAYLVIEGAMSAGAVVAGSILTARALAPAEQVIANWRNLVSAQQAWKRLKDLFGHFPDEEARIEIPAPTSVLSVEGLYMAPPADPRQPTVQNVNFTIKAGTVLGIVGPSGSGKSTLVRGIVGVWPLMRGRVRFDLAALDQWSSQDRGRFIGYMPQSIELFPGTIAENIARLDPDAAPAKVVAAAKAANVHDVIVSLPKGYETLIGEAGMGLSMGQKQRIALARALYGDPFVVVLDEPNSNLDTDGERALTQAIVGIRQRGGIVIVVAHRKSILGALDMVLVMDAGNVRSLGPRDSMLEQALGKRPLKVVEREGKPA